MQESSLILWQFLFLPPTIICVSMTRQKLNKKVPNMAQKSLIDGPIVTERTMVARKSTVRVYMIDPQQVKSFLVLTAQAVSPTTTAAVKVAASKTIIQFLGPTLIQAVATIQLTQTVKTRSRAQLIGTFLSIPQHIRAQMDTTQSTTTQIKRGTFMTIDVIQATFIAI